MKTIPEYIFTNGKTEGLQGLRSKSKDNHKIQTSGIHKMFIFYQKLEFIQENLLKN